MHSLDTIKTLAEILLAKSWKMAAAESCTGGLVCATLTELAGSSEWFERGYITYSNAAKEENLGVPAELIQSFGAVSEQVAKAMAEGAQANSGANAAISITGIAGPSGGSADKPVGTVCFGWAIQNDAGENRALTKTMHFAGDRQAIRKQACNYVISELAKLLEN
ncbi:damage-inducible protein CinA [Polynucleobacter wuianus]|uniref:Damage-inducible protein CinA n=1 Tax=Polynucleobacter wuianus TaxID=1743168 RepID=A0A191UCZ4_9BURK|nr:MULTISPECIES: CinA family protein [Polynucleobacter]ANI98832.1 damage-inducible protein CinA [Polynucleobacter wuianus]MBU3553404.1 CinA family protein [Polynucleobacter sp. MWH-Post4-6-1]MBU3610151.1 CinA family protein [Polynucleobacter wuianus]